MRQVTLEAMGVFLVQFPVHHVSATLLRGSGDVVFIELMLLSFAIHAGI